MSVQEQLQAAARRIIADAISRFVTQGKSSGYVDASIADMLPFSSRQNVFDTEVERVTQRLIPSRGTSEIILQEEIVQILGRVPMSTSELERLSTTASLTQAGY